MFTAQQICGLSRDHVTQFSEPRYAATPATAAAFLRLCAAARLDGIELVPYASYRDFTAQLRIWNKKFSGNKTLYDEQERGREFAALDEEQLVWAILGWHSLPGASRRHWGTDIDVIDRAVMPEGYKVALLPSEVAPGGIFHELHRWLDAHIDAFGFYRPYQHLDGIGMYAEPWHLSYAPEAQQAASAFDVNLLAASIAQADMLGKERVLAMLPQIVARHVRGVARPGPLAAAMAADHPAGGADTAIKTP
jgi:LAS superfamily LD-carboxypeptidase LdcB